MKTIMIKNVVYLGCTYAMTLVYEVKPIWQCNFLGATQLLYKTWLQYTRQRDKERCTRVCNDCKRR